MKSRRLTKSVRITFICLVWIYVGLVALLNMPPVKEAVAGRTAVLLSDFLGTEVRIGTIGLGFLNSAAVEDLYVKDRDGRELLRVAHVSATVNLRDLINGQITLEGAQLFGVDACLRKATPESEPNFQFIVDALSSDSEEKTPLKLKLSSIILRHANITYDVESEPQTKGLFNTNHINIADAALTAGMTIREGEVLSFVIRRMDGKETNSGLSLNKMTFTAKALADGVSVSKMYLETNALSLDMDSTIITYTDWGKADGGEWAVKTRINKAVVKPAELSCFLSSLGGMKNEFTLSTDIMGGSKGWMADNVRLASHNKSLLLNMDAIYHPDSLFANNRIDCTIDTLWADAAVCDEICKAANVDDSIRTFIRRVGNIGLTGKLKKEKTTIASQARLTTECGQVAVDFDANSAYFINLDGKDINLGRLLNDNKLGKTSITATAEGVLEKNKMPQGKMECTVHEFGYAGYTYNNINVNALSDGTKCSANAKITDHNIRMVVKGDYAVNASSPSCSLHLRLNDFNPHALNLTEDYAQETFDLQATADIIGSDINDVAGMLRLDSIKIFTPEAIYLTDSVVVASSAVDKDIRRITVNGDFIDAELQGNVDYERLRNSVLSLLSLHLPALFKSDRNTNIANRLDFDCTIRESQLVKHLLKADYTIHSPLNIHGRLDDTRKIMDVNVKSGGLTYNGATYRNLQINTKQTADRLSVAANIDREEEQGLTRLALLSKAVDNRLDTQFSWTSYNTLEPYSGFLDANTLFSDTTGNLSASIQFRPSEITVKDTVWSIQPSNIDISDDRFVLHNFRISHDRQHLIADGAVSKEERDSLNVDIREVPVEYLQDLANFHPVRLMGRLSGKATLKSLYSDLPMLDAKVQIDNMHFQGGHFGNADLHVLQNRNTKGIEIKGVITDTEDCYTEIDGYVSPKDKEIDLLISTHNTNAAFLNGFIGSIFDDIEGRVNGDLRVCGPLNDIGLQGDVATNVALTLHPTQVRYRIDGDTLRFRPYRFNFEDVTIRDEKNNRGMVNGYVGHKNLKNFRYKLSVDMDNLLCYDEDEFNSDKFYATVYADGGIDIDGADKEPLNIRGTITTGRNSVFAYDVATPDAITNSNFVTFRNRTSKKNHLSSNTTSTTVTSAPRSNEYKYSGDIYMTLNIALNNNCEIKLRMDNTEDGYMSTYGHGALQAIYHNKSPFQLNGTYHIDRGSYRLFLQDLIFRDLAIQQGSHVDFAGDPFAADINLICHHTLNSVPLSDLTASTAYSYNNKVKVVCILDITGTLANMDFKFDLDLPNVNEETKQLVRSMINSEEERNTQLIYLLGLGRFYPNEYARAANEETNSSAMSSLMASTLSGQINQMLSSAIGKNSKWNFGTGLNTGERGWEDLDVEGILSGRLFNDRLLINGNFGYRDNELTQTSNFVGDFDVRWRITETGNTYIKAYNQANDRYFTKATLNTQGIGISYERDFETWTDLFRFLKRRKKNAP